VPTLRYGRGHLALSKADDLIGLKTTPSNDVNVLAEIAPWLEEAARTAKLLGGFHVVSVVNSDEPMEPTLDRLRADRRIDKGTHTYYTSLDGVPFVPNAKLFVRFRRKAPFRERLALLASLFVEVVNYRDADTIIAEITTASANPVTTAAALQASPLVRVAEPCLATEGEGSSFVAPSDPLIGIQWHLDNLGDVAGLQRGADARVRAAWNRAGSTGSRHAVIAMIDDGFDLAHPEFGGHEKIVHPVDFEHRTANPAPIARGDTHGTQCAGVAVANADGRGVAGVAPGSPLMPIRWDRHWDDLKLEEWFDYVRVKGAAVLSCSWKAKAKVFELSTPVSEAIERCAKESRGGLGCVICFSAGNDGSNVDAPACGSVNGFAIHPDVLAVTALNSLDVRPAESSWGDAIAVCAPAGGTDGLGLVTTDIHGPGGTTTLGDGNITEDFFGSSGAAPVVAGVCALVVSLRPRLTAAQTRRLIRKTARRVDDLLTHPGQRHSVYVGHGCVDADAAVREALRIEP
jgi:hypothetical protein